MFLNQIQRLKPIFKILWSAEIWIWKSFSIEFNHEVKGSKFQHKGFLKVLFPHHHPNLSTSIFLILFDHRHKTLRVNFSLNLWSRSSKIKFFTTLIPLLPAVERKFWQHLVSSPASSALSFHLSGLKLSQTFRLCNKRTRKRVERHFLISCIWQLDQLLRSQTCKIEGREPLAQRCTIFPCYLGMEI